MNGLTCIIIGAIVWLMLWTWCDEVRRRRKLKKRAGIKYTAK